MRRLPEAPLDNKKWAASPPHATPRRRAHKITDKYSGHLPTARMLWSAPELPPKSEKKGRPSGGPRLFLVARRRPVRGSLAPVAGSASQPFESRMIGNSLEHPREKISIVGRKAQFAAIVHDLRQDVEHFAGNEAAPLMASLWPRVGKQYEDALDRRRRKRRDQQPRVAGEEPDVFDATTLYVRQQFCDPVFEYFATDEADFGMMFGLNGKVLAPTEPDFKPNRPVPGAEHATRIQLARHRDRQCEPRQQIADQDLLSRAKRSPAAATE
jgi:hypothetical protein